MKMSRTYKVEIAGNVSGYAEFEIEAKDDASARNIVDSIIRDADVTTRFEWGFRYNPSLHEATISYVDRYSVEDIEIDSIAESDIQRGDTEL